METVRRIEEYDFEAVSLLYNGKKSKKELKWLFANPDESNFYNAFVATNNKNQIIGVIGFVKSNYTQNNTQYLGTIPISWKILENYKGMAGVLLFKKVMKLGDFGITIAGSETAKDLYKLFKYKYFSSIDQYYKILNPQKAFKSLHRKNFLKTLGMFTYLLPSYFYKSKINKFDNDIKLIKYNDSNFSEELENTSVFKKKINKNYIDWLLDCPVLKTYAFTIKKENKFLGTAVLYIKGNHKVKKGRITYLPYLGEDIKVWSSVIKKCIAFLKDQNCCIVDCVAHNNMHHDAYIKSGFINIKKHSKPLYIKDSNHLLKNVDVKNWYLQYSEGDKAYRSF